MSQFPKTEADIAALALVVIEGLEQAAEDFPNPPVSPVELRAKLDAFNAANTGAIAAETTAQGQHAVKDDALADLAHSVIQRKPDGTPWEDIGISTDTEELCSNQPRAVELYYRVFAVNKAGTGQPSAARAVRVHQEAVMESREFEAMGSETPPCCLSAKIAVS